MKLHKAFAALLCATVLAGCEKNAVRDLTGPLPSAQVMFFNFGVGAPPVNFYANDTKVTAVFSATGEESTSGVSYGGVAAGGLYTGIEPGQYTFSGRISSATEKGLPISNLAVTIADGKRYSFYQSGPYDSDAKTVDAFIVEDDFPASIDNERAHVRFVHAIANAEPMILYATDQTTGEEFVIGGAVENKSAGAFTPVPNGIYELSARYPGSAESAISRTNVTFNVRKVYTIGARGDITVTSKTASTRPVLDLDTNR